MSKYYTTKKDEFVWKKIKTNLGRYTQQYLLSMMIPEGTKCYGSKTGKNRAEKAIPLNFYEGERGDLVLHSRDLLKLKDVPRIKHIGHWMGQSITYTLNKIVKPKRPFAVNKFSGECASGIHFFYDHEKALNW